MPESLKDTLREYFIGTLNNNEILLLLQSPGFDVSISEFSDSAASKIVKMDDKLPMTAPRTSFKTYYSL